MARRRAVLWATGISLALVLGSGLMALGAGALAEPPVDHAGSFAASVAHFTPTSTAAATSQPRAGLPDDATPTSRRPHARPNVHPPSASVAPSTPREVEPHEATTGPAGTTATSPDDAHESEHESPELEPQEHEPQEHEPQEHELDD